MAGPERGDPGRAAPGRHLTGLPYIDVTSFAEAIEDYGFSLFDWTGDVLGSRIATDNPVIVDATTITLEITGSLAGVTKVEVGYATRGTAAAEPAVGQVVRSACTGNVFRAATYTGPFSETTLVWSLAEFREIITL